MNQFLLKKLHPRENLYLDFVTQIPSDKTFKLEEMKTALGGKAWKTVNEVFNGEEKVFAGTISEFDDSVQGANLLTYKILCTDYTFLFDKKLVPETYEDQNVSDIVRDIITRFTDGFTSVNVEDVDHVINFVQFDYARPTDALRDLADLISYDWYVDYEKDIHFFPRGSRFAPFNLADDNNSYEGKSLKLKKSGKQIKNVVYVIGSDYVGDEVTDKIGEGDGKQKRFNLPYRYDKKTTCKVGQCRKNSWDRVFRC